MDRRGLLRVFGGSLAASAVGVAAQVALGSKESFAAPNLTIKEVFISYTGQVTTNALPANASYIGALDAGGSTGVGGGSGYTLMFEVDTAEPTVSRTFRSFKKDDAIDGAVWVRRGLGWFQRLGSGATTRFAVYEAL